MKHYWAIELSITAALTAALLEIPMWGSLRGVVPIVILAWIVLQLVSSVAFCNAINKRTITVSPGSAGSKETYGVADGAKPGWLVMRHVWTYKLITQSKATVPAPPPNR